VLRGTTLLPLHRGTIFSRPY